jgi:GntR family transcriptional regulator/MocR family aminotransferase
VSRVPATPVTVVLDRSSGLPLALQIAERIRALVQSGTLASPDRLPSSRSLATELGVARGVVEQAFDQLSAEGWVESRRGAGTFVASAILRMPTAARSAASRTATRHAAGRSAKPTIRLDTGSPWIDPRHDGGWKRAWRTVAAARIPNGYPDAAGLPALREAIAAHVAVHRGVTCTADQVMVTSGTTHAFDLALAAAPRAAVAIEDPGYRAAVATARQRGWDVVDIPVDDDGIDVGVLARQARSDIRAVYVTPAHQHPLGAVMSAARRTALLAEVRRRGALVIEDDYDSEFRYDVAPLPALAQFGLDQVTYLGTASKAIAPGLRAGWMVAHEDRIADIARARAERHDLPSWPVQRALLAMFEDGQVSRLIRSSRRMYAERSRLVCDRLSPYGVNGPEVAGMYVSVDLPAEIAQRIVQRAAKLGVEVPSVADYCRTSTRAGLVVGFGGVTAAELTRALDVIVAALSETGYLAR